MGTAQSSSSQQRMYASGDTKELERIRTFVESKAKEFGFSEQGAYTITLAVDEACSNLIRHSYKHDESKEFSVDINFSNDQLVIEIIDSGTAFDPLTVPPPNLLEYAEQHRRGGFGVHIIRKLMDIVEYFPADTVHPFNRLKLIKKLN